MHLGNYIFFLLIRSLMRCGFVNCRSIDNWNLSSRSWDMASQKKQLHFLQHSSEISLTLKFHHQKSDSRRNQDRFSSVRLFLSLVESSCLDNPWNNVDLWTERWIYWLFKLHGGVSQPDVPEIRRHTTEEVADTNKPKRFLKGFNTFSDIFVRWTSLTQVWLNEPKRLIWKVYYKHPKTETF